MVYSSIINLHILKASGRLDQFVNQIEQEFDTAVNKITKVLPISNVDVLIYDNPINTITELGIGGYCPNSHLVEISIDPGFTNISKTISSQFKRTLAHELHHTIRWRNPGYGETLLEVLISEGLADHFDMEINSATPQSWNKSLNKEQLMKMKFKAEKEYNNKNYNHNDWFFGSKEKGIPKWTGYNLGFHLVSEYLKKHPKEAMIELYNIPSKQFIK